MPSPAPRLVALMSLLAVLAFWIATQFLGGLVPSGSREEQDRAKIRLGYLAELRASDERTIEHYGWVDREKGVVRVPIEQAMKMVIPELNARRPAPAYPIATPAP